MASTLVGTPTAAPGSTGPGSTVPGTAADRLLVGLFVFATFLGAGLLFLVQPMVAKMLLPRLGGTPDVWNTAMVFFQAVLLAGYAFAHASTSRLGMRRQPVVQLIVLLLPLAFLPVAVPAGWEPPAGTAPALWTLFALTVAVGAPFFVLATSSPTLQRWFSVTDHPAAGDPYFLYAAGNVGSLLALVGYPLVFEPRFSLQDQARVWSIGYVVFVVACGGCVVMLRRRRAAPLTTRSDDPAARTDTAVEPVTAAAPIPWRRRGWWVLLAFVPSALMIAVTRHISTDIASVPLLWVIPLALYLVSFIAAFGRDPTRLVSASSRLVRLLVVPVALTFVATFGSVWLVLVPHLAVFFLVALLAHGRLALDRPHPGRLTEFYLWISVGGVLGGIACALLAPVLFDSVVEYPLILGVALALRTPTADEHRSKGRTAWLPAGYALAITGLVAAALLLQHARTDDARVGPSMLLLGVAAAVVYLGARSTRSFAAGLTLVLATTIFISPLAVLHAERTFFGVHRVLLDDQDRHLLANGTTTHGMQDPRHPGEPLGYYHRDGPIGEYFASLEPTGGPRRVAVIGLGSGALAAYGRARDSFTFYEIDPAVARIASDPAYFSYLAETPADTRIVLGDGRLSIGHDADARYDLVVLDAFSSDAVPVHLLTQQAVELYRSRLAPGGVLAFHVSNRYFELAPVLNRVAEEIGMSGVIGEDDPGPAEAATGHISSEWVLLSRSPTAFGAFEDTEGWYPLGLTGPAPLWTDSFSDLLGVFRWPTLG